MQLPAMYLVMQGFDHISLGLSRHSHVQMLICLRPAEPATRCESLRSSVLACACRLDGAAH